MMFFLVVANAIFKIYFFIVAFPKIPKTIDKIEQTFSSWLNYVLGTFAFGG